MCFYNDDYDWTASIWERSDVEVADKPVKCDECGKLIQIGEISHHVYAQEHEECQACEDGVCECNRATEDDHQCECEDPDYGECSHYDCCDECERFLKAIEASEKEAGCPPYERRPQPAMMVESIREMESSEARRYLWKAGYMFPELKVSGYLDRMTKTLCWRDDDDG